MSPEAAAGSQLRESVTRPAHGLDVAGVLGVRLYLLTDVLYVYVCGTDLAEEVATPEVSHDLLAVVDPPRRGGQEREDLKLLGGQLDGPSSSKYLSAQEVYREARELELFLHGRAGSRAEALPPQVRSHAANELPGREGLGDVVVGPNFQAHHDARLVVAGGEHDHRHVV